MRAYLKDIATIPVLTALVLAGAWLALPGLFVLAPLLLALCLAALHSGVRASYHKIGQSTLAQTKQRYGLMLSLTQAGVYAALFGWLAHYFLSFPNRD